MKSRFLRGRVAGLIGAGLAWSLAAPPTFALAGAPEVRGTCITTTGIDAFSTPASAALAIRRLHEIGLNTLAFEVWTNGKTRFPSSVLERTTGAEGQAGAGSRDLLQETLIEAHRNQLLWFADFGQGFVVADKARDTPFRTVKPDWLSLDSGGKDVAPDGRVWINPLNPEARQFLLDLILESVDAYDLDGVQLGEQLGWPAPTMGYDASTRKLYAEEHAGNEPPSDPLDATWTRWRATKVTECAERLIREVRKARPGLLLSLSPGVYPKSNEDHMMVWPAWASWRPGDSSGRWWDAFVPQCFQTTPGAFEKSWLEQISCFDKLGGGRRVTDLVAGIRITRDGPEGSWSDLRRSIDFVRRTGGGGHMLSDSRGVLDVYSSELKQFYSGNARHPARPADWRPAPIPFKPDDGKGGATGDASTSTDWMPLRDYRVILRRSGAWTQPVTIAMQGTDAIEFGIRESRSDGAKGRLRTQVQSLASTPPSKAPGTPTRAPDEDSPKPIGEMPDLAPKPPTPRSPPQTPAQPTAGTQPTGTIALDGGLVLTWVVDLPDQGGSPARGGRIRLTLARALVKGPSVHGQPVLAGTEAIEAEVLVDRRSEMARAVSIAPTPTGR